MKAILFGLVLYCLSLAPMRRLLKKNIYNKIKPLFPVDYKDNKLSAAIKFCQSILNQKINKINGPRIFNGQKESDKIIAEFSNLPESGEAPNLVYQKIVSNFFVNIPRWRHPELQYNVGAAVNTAACALYSLALDDNIYNINDGLAGNSLLAEQAVTNILLDLAGSSKRGFGLFTFGGTATNYYATKIGLKKAIPDSGKSGLSRRVRVFVTEDAHFSHSVSADWLGIGTNNVVIIKSNKNRTSDIDDAERKIRRELRQGNIVSSIIINGGTTYGHVIDNIRSFARLRDRLVREFLLSYVPHLHVDSVIGWTWLMFKDYDFVKNDLGINKAALADIKKQYKKIAEIKYADSWGADFHKGVGACPVDCSIIMVNDIKDISLLSKKNDTDFNTHQLAPEFSLNSPADYTLETSRSGGPPLAALAALYSLGKKGFQRNLANLVEQSICMRELFLSYDDFAVCNKNNSHGYVTMVRAYPPELKNNKRKAYELDDKSLPGADFVQSVNKYMKEFFLWDKKTRMDKGLGVEYSFSSGYLVLGNGTKVSGIKLYPVSPHFNRQYAKSAVKDIVRQKRYFDKNVWSKKT